MAAGQLLVEVLIALTVITVALVATLSVSIRAIRVGRTARNRLEAIRYAESAIEQLKRSKESDQETFFANKVCPFCGPYGVDNIYQCRFDCNFSADDVSVKASITWKEAGSDVSVNLETVLTKARL